MKKIYLIFVAGIWLILTTCGTTSNSGRTDWSNYPEFNNNGYIIREFEETPEAFANPMKGFRPGVDPYYWNFYYREYASVYRCVIRYSDLEATSQDSVQKIIDWSNRAWAGIEKRNIKVIPRVVLTWPLVGGDNYSPDNESYEWWPNDITQESRTSRWYSQELEDRLKYFVRKLGQAWDNDPRVAAVELGLWGYFGEHTLFSDLGDFQKGVIPPSMQKALGDAFTEAFKNKKVMTRFPTTFNNYKFGFFEDCFAHPERGMLNVINKNVWREQMISGEIAYDIESSRYGKTPDDTLRNNRYTDYVINWINRCHASSLSWISQYTQGDPSLRDNAIRMQKALGYRFVIRSAVYKETVSNGEEVRLGFKVSNAGSAPFYYKWPVEISLLDKNRNVVYKKNLDIDIRSWLPGETYTIVDNITIPNNLTSDTYILAVSILDPAGNNPSLRFANTNYYNGGRTPIGIIGINKEPQGDFGKFDNLRIDRSLQYTVGNVNSVNRTINREQGIICTFDRWYPNSGNGSVLNIRSGSETINGNSYTTFTMNGNQANEGYAQVWTMGNAATVNNLKRMKAFSFTVLGDGNDYKLSLQTTDTFTPALNYNHYHIVFSTIKGETTNYTVYIDQLVQDGEGRSRPMQFIQSNIQGLQLEPVFAGQYDLKIWDVKIYN